MDQHIPRTVLLDVPGFPGLVSLIYPGWHRFAADSQHAGRLWDMLPRGITWRYTPNYAVLPRYRYTAGIAALPDHQVCQVLTAGAPLATLPRIVAQYITRIPCLAVLHCCCPPGG